MGNPAWMTRLFGRHSCVDWAELGGISYEDWRTILRGLFQLAERWAILRG